MNPETTSGGRALKFFASIRVSIRAGEQIKEGKDEVIGHTMNIRIVKNKTAQPYRKASFDLIYGQGIDNLAEIIDIAEIAGYMQKSGAYYQIREDANDKNTIINRHFNGELIKLSFYKKDWLTYLNQDTELKEILEDLVRNGGYLNIGQVIGESEEVIENSEMIETSSVIEENIEDVDDKAILE